MAGEEGRPLRCRNSSHYRSRVQSRTLIQHANHARRLPDRTPGSNSAEKMRSRLSRSLKRGIASDGGVFEGSLDRVEHE